MTEVKECSVRHDNCCITCTCFCPKCECFVGVNREGKCDGCWEQICFLQDINNNFEFVTGEIQN